MNPQSSSSTLTLDSSQLHCRHRTASGRRCRMVVSESDSSLCVKHAAIRQSELHQVDVASKLIGDTVEFRSAVDINRSLGELYKLQAHNQIAPRRAAVMAYTANLLLRTLPAIQKELHPEEEGPDTFDFSNWPRSPQDPLPDNPSGHPGQHS